MTGSFNSIDVRLVSFIDSPFELAVASARTCYSGKGVVLPSEVSVDERSVELRDRIGASTLGAGHLTTRQHASFVFAISGVSRQFIWNFLHSHPYYNSEQVSQRYVRVKPSSFLMPPISETAASIFRECVEFQISTYESLIEILRGPIGEEFYARFPGRRKDPARWAGAVNKRCYEIARYVLGIGTTAYLYHTISALTLLRYRRLSRLFDTPTEQQIVIEKMIESVRSKDPLFEKDLVDPEPLEDTLEYRMFQRARTPQATLAFLEEFDSALEGRTSKLVRATEGADGVLAESVRLLAGLSRGELSDTDAIESVLNPQHNKILADTLNPSVMDRASQSLHHIHFTFQKKISHTADSQDQRHRTVLSSRPSLGAHFTGRPDFITPFAITQVPEAEEIYRRSMRNSFEAVTRCIESGVSPEFAHYLLPNAVPIRMISSGSLHSWHHKWKMRSCYNAQEEIFRATMDEIRQIEVRFPAIGAHLRAPCYLRLKAGVKPYCPEGDHFCGLPVWKYSLDDYRRKSL